MSPCSAHTHLQHCKTRCIHRLEIAHWFRKAFSLTAVSQQHWTQIIIFNYGLASYLISDRDILEKQIAHGAVGIVTESVNVVDLKSRKNSWLYRLDSFRNFVFLFWRSIVRRRIVLVCQDVLSKMTWKWKKRLLEFTLRVIHIQLSCKRHLTQSEFSFLAPRLLKMKMTEVQK